ncbi:Clp protease N-terminal domain-containing protein [Streptacidiphilus jiangxiensis]|uniref:Clp amino terminal domain-containing protein, pathogenicity island component n=1 Tax=Streptacidiphilus jiangxiensis TaxID=235985 RepID=A0A1H7HM85_STRJI|nr:Clp protease N-terminal domain-containing protein [Streptacidiphilus jiangxiensis]SEK51369.1 Clp amino terminal domain-containing protein, pathogenicity island component [Streptacidiphilus jiangxiensis]
MSPLDISLADLIARLDEELPAADELARISAARLRAQTLSDLGDQLVDHYVSNARRAGASWSEIGDAIGVSKQAAQQRHTPAAFERFTDLNRHGIVLAQEAARTHRHDFIGTEHLLLGLLGEPRGLAHALLVAQAGTEQRVREAVEDVMTPPGEKMLRGHIAFHPESKQAIDQARAAATDLGHDRVGTEHLLLGLIRVTESPAARILGTLGFASDALHETVRTEIAARFPSGGPDAQR